MAASYWVGKIGPEITLPVIAFVLATGVDRLARPQARARPARPTAMPIP